MAIPRPATEVAEVAAGQRGVPVAPPPPPRLAGPSGATNPSGPAAAPTGPTEQTALWGDPMPAAAGPRPGSADAAPDEALPPRGFGDPSDPSAAPASPGPPAGSAPWARPAAPAAAEAHGGATDAPPQPEGPAVTATGTAGPTAPATPAPGGAPPPATASPSGAGSPPASPPDGAGDALPRRRRGPQQPVPETAYLTAQDVRHYRPLMRFFLEQHQAQRFFLGVDEAHAHVQQAYDAAYTLEQCRSDLEQLVAWGNLTRHYERSRVRTIEEFLRRQAVYQCTPEGVAVERFVATLEEGGRRGGSLDRTVLEALLQRMRELDALLAEEATLRALEANAAAGERPVAGRGGEALYRVSSLWTEVRHHFERAAHDGVGYLGQLRGIQAQQILERAAFQAYKDVLVRYLSAYALALAETGPMIAAISRRWAQGSRGRLLAHGVAVVAARQPLPDGSLPSLAEETARVEAAIAALARWFHPAGGDIERLKRSTNDAIELVTRQAARLAELRWGTRSRRHELEELALLFHHCADLPQAERVASVAFAAGSPRHPRGEWIPEGLGHASPWREPAADVVLAPVRRGTRAQSGDDPAPARHAERDDLVRAGLRDRRAAAQRLEGLFPDGRLDLGAVHVVSTALRDELLDLVGRCLASADGVAEAPDGGRLAVLQWLPEVGSIAAPDGVCHVPRLVLAWEPGRDLAAAAAAATAEVGGEGG